MYVTTGERSNVCNVVPIGMRQECARNGWYPRRYGWHPWRYGWYPRRNLDDSPTGTEKLLSPEGVKLRTSIFDVVRKAYGRSRGKERKRWKEEKL